MGITDNGLRRKIVGIQYYRWAISGRYFRYMTDWWVSCGWWRYGRGRLIFTDWSVGPSGLIREWNTGVDELVFLNLMTGARRLLTCPNIRGSTSMT